MGPSQSLENTLNFFRRLIPKRLFRAAQPPYHYLLALIAAVIYRFPSRKIKVVAITGTKGKTTTAELVNAVLEEAGFKTALVSTLRIKVGGQAERNLYKMSTPGRFFLQRFLSRAVAAGCQYAVLEITSEAAKLRRHRFIDFDALIFTGIAPEHIESHGSFENYLAAKLSIGNALARSNKRPRIMIASSESEHAQKFLGLPVEMPIPSSPKEAAPYTLHEDSSEFTLEGVRMKTTMPGLFNLGNIVAAWHFAKTQGIPLKAMRRAVEKVRVVPGRMERVEAGQKFSVIVDYAHTPDSLAAAYSVFARARKICVLGSCGGGRDRWKRPEMGAIAGEYCDMVILTDEDPYDEDPVAIVEEVAVGVRKYKKPEIIMNRREAIKKAVETAAAWQGHGEHVAVLITGKGTDPYICGPRGTKEPWNDGGVAREELEKLTQKTP